MAAALAFPSAARISHTPCVHCTKSTTILDRSLTPSSRPEARRRAGWSESLRKGDKSEGVIARSEPVTRAGQSSDDKGQALVATAASPSRER